jgi:hypothetical protein
VCFNTWYADEKQLQDEKMTLESLKASCALRIVDLEMYMTHCEITTSKSVPTLKRNLAGLSNTRYRDVCREQIKCLCEIADCRATIKSIDRLLEERLYPTVIYTESMEINSDSMLVSNDKINGQQNMTDVVGMDVEEKDAGDTHATEQGQRNLLGLQDFLSRPIPLTSFQIPVSTDVSVELSIWDLFTLNPAVRAKLRNYLSYGVIYMYASPYQECHSIQVGYWRHINLIRYGMRTLRNIKQQ